MAKGKAAKRFIQSLPHGKRSNVLLFQRATMEILPKVYAGFVMTLHYRFGLDYEDIVLALNDTTKAWRLNSEIDIVEQCRLLTGIDVMSELTAAEEGEEEGARV